MRTTSILLASLILPLGLPAQDATAESALTIRTNHDEIVEGVLQMFDSDAEPPSLEKGSIAILSLDDGGQVNVRTGQGDVFLEIDCRPAQLMEMFAAEVAQGQQMAQMMAGMGGAQMGLGFEEAGQIVTGAFSFPTQIDRLHFRFPKNAEKTKQIEFDLALVPVADTWFAGLVSAMRPNPKGVLMLPGDDAMVQANFNMDMQGLWKSLRPIAAPFAGLGLDTKQEKADAARYLDTTMKGLEGTVSVVFAQGGGGVRSVAGLVDGNEIGKIMGEDGYQRTQIAAAEIGDMAEASFEAKALEHRGVSISKLVAIYDDPEANPFANEDGELHTYTAVTDGAMVQVAFGASDAEVKALLDEVLDEKLTRKQLPPNALAVAKIRLVDFVGFLSEMSQGMMQADTEEIPETLTAELKRTDKGISVQVRTK